jgi:hypothetical protein
MKTNQDKWQKRAYSTPKIDSVQLDNEISLQLESNPQIPAWETNAIEQSNPNIHTILQG